ncbi:TetR/AcrR family transcriptional regulator [Methyloraptor flagellatus]|jgi:TetR/AcrR family transcriptional repressor of mexJK operon|uniref:TetR/AcrR family transcriptional regulator n=1 Tax=Methyloraptor flagellatus TaxID=3162530 RepID=A0AAU7XD20_9HYPH
MAEPTDRSAGKTEAILEAAKRVFLKDGFASSVDRIAAEAGVAKQTIYSRFGSKEGLLRAMADRLKWPIGAFFQSDGPAGDVLTAVGEATLERIVSTDMACLSRLLIAQATEFPDLARLNYEMGPLRTRGLLADYLDRLVREGRMPPADTTEAADVFLSLLQGLYRHGLLLGAIEPPDPAVRTAHVARTVERFRRLYDLKD